MNTQTNNPHKKIIYNYMKIYIPLSNIYKIKYGKTDYTTLQSFQEQLFDGFIDYPYDLLEKTMNEYMQDERKQATQLALDILHEDPKYKHVTLNHLNTPEAKDHIDYAFLRSLEDAWRNSYIDEYTRKFKDEAFENLQKLLDNTLQLDYSKLELYTEKSKYIEENTITIKSLDDLQQQWDDTPPELWDTTHLVITTNRANATEVVNNDGWTYDIEPTDTNDDVADYLHDVIVNELSTIHIDTEYFDRYGTLGDMDNWKDYINDHLADATHAIKQDIEREEKEEAATIALYDAARNSTLLNIKEYDGRTITAKHNGNMFDITVSFRQ